MKWGHNGKTTRPGVRVYGASDDLVEVEGVFGIAEFDCYDDVAVLEFGDGGGGVRLRVVYGYPSKPAAGVWSIAVEPLDDGVPMFAVVMTAAAHGYSSLATVTCPVGTAVRAHCFKPVVAPSSEPKVYVWQVRESVDHEGCTLSGTYATLDAGVRRANGMVAKHVEGGGFYGGTWAHEVLGPWCQMWSMEDVHIVLERVEVMEA